MGWNTWGDLDHCAALATSLAHPLSEYYAYKYIMHVNLFKHCVNEMSIILPVENEASEESKSCLLYTSDAADE